MSLEGSLRQRLNDEDADGLAAKQQGDRHQGGEALFSGFGEIAIVGVFARAFHHHWRTPLGGQAHQAFAHR